MNFENHLKFIMVVWQDPSSRDEWDSKEIHDGECNYIVSAGIVLSETEEKYVIALNCDISADQWSQSLIIPKGLIKSIKCLQVKKSKDQA